MLSIAGFDPSGGAGILADVKTFESFGVYGLGVLSANTIQHEERFEEIEWVHPEWIKKQISILYEKHPFIFVKIGVVQNLSLLKEILNYLISLSVEIKIVWDPVISSSSGFQFWEVEEQKLLDEVLEKVFLLTPNMQEIVYLSGTDNEEKLLNWMAVKRTGAILLKGGHREGDSRNDILLDGQHIHVMKGDPYPGAEKHGSGCVLSAAITALLANGFGIHDACIQAKQYIHQFLLSNQGLLGYHYARS